MIGFKIDQAKGLFFDAPKIVAAVDRATRQVLSKFGAYVRTAARSSIRKRRRISEAGSPPSSHTGILKRFLYFGYDPERESVVIGPARTNQIFVDGNGQPEGGLVPPVLEYGGRISVLEVRYPGGKWHPVSLRRFRSGRVAEYQEETRRRVVTIQPRPYMHPALNQELPKLPAMWRNSVKR
jgi:hypothetical protein